MKIPAPQFDIFETVGPTPDAAIKPAALVGKVEHRSWVEFDGQEGYWRYAVRWPGGGTSSESDKYLQTADRIYCDIKIVVGGAPTKIETWTTESVASLIERGLTKAGVPTSSDDLLKWTLRTDSGRKLRHLVGDANPVDGTTVLFLDPQEGGRFVVEEPGDEELEGSYEGHLLREREESRAGEDHFKHQRDSALNCLRWLIGDLLPNGDYNPGGPGPDPDDDDA